MSPEQFVDQCLDLMGPIEMGSGTRDELISHAENGGAVNWEGDDNYAKSTVRTGEMLALIGATREYQFG
jgi:hypothetical protein